MIEDINFDLISNIAFKFGAILFFKNNYYLVSEFREADNNNQKNDIYGKNITNLIMNVSDISQIDGWQNKLEFIQNKRIFFHKDIEWILFRS